MHLFTSVEQVRPGDNRIREKHLFQGLYRNSTAYSLTLIGAIIFTCWAGLLFLFNLSAYLNRSLRLQNPQAVTAIWMFGPQLIIGISVLFISLIGAGLQNEDSKKLSWIAFVLVLFSFAYLAVFFFGITVFITLF